MLPELSARQIRIVQRWLEEGFELVSYAHFAKYLAVSRDPFVALVEPAAEGFRLFGQAGYRFPEGIGLLIEKGEGKRFVWHGQAVEADVALLEKFQRFQEELARLLAET